MFDCLSNPLWTLLNVTLKFILNLPIINKTSLSLDYHLFLTMSILDTKDQFFITL